MRIFAPKVWTVAVADCRTGNLAAITTLTFSVELALEPTPTGCELDGNACTLDSDCCSGQNKKCGQSCVRCGAYGLPSHVFLSMRSHLLPGVPTIMLMRLIQAPTIRA